VLPLPGGGRRGEPVIGQVLLQWDDELVARADGLALFDAFGSACKTLHANPGRHGEVPLSELDSTERFFARHLGDRGPLLASWHQ
jgi:hypothetical protein